ncbi:hypothetical protein NE562_05555 [Butyricicoccus faecihominis]|uniref:hypothetical protein n=1 Tax=Butyricicoccus faecihominis TaxID=1712515 RepID=UPI00247A0770|nr:hypothetical protein [Butyricicoccus faecihominis]MCQ5129118.1 hypothetical protein [Butyricicoccus faecihominis]
MSWRPIETYLEFGFRTGGKDKSDKRLFDEWVQDKDIVRWTYGPNELVDLPRYLRTGHRYYVPGAFSRGARYELPPRMDHATMFKSRSGKCWLTYQPYYDAADTRLLVDDWAERHGLRAVVYEKDESWYYPGSTCLVVIDAPDELGRGNKR